MQKIYLFISFFIITLTAVSFSQSSVDTLEYIKETTQTNSLFSNYDKQLNTYFLNTGINLSGNFSTIDLNLFENFRSTLFNSSTQSIRDEHFLVFSGKYKFYRKFNLGLSANSTILSDDRNIQLNKATINYVTLFGEIKLKDNFIISPFGGFSSNKQVAVIDGGPVYGVEGLAHNLNFTDFIISSDFKFRNEDILPRRNLLRYFNLGITNPFNQFVRNNLLARYSSSRKDFYFPADSITSSAFNITNNIEGRTESIFNLQDRLLYNKLLEVINFEVSGGVNWRVIDRDKRYKTAELQSPSIFDTRIEELILSLGTSFNYSSSFLDATLRINYSERDEKHKTKPFDEANPSFFEQRSELESRKNNISTRALISLSGRINLSGTDKIIYSLYQSKLRYDTPSPDNDDDRDELLSIARLRYSKRLSPFFEAFVNVEGTQSHVVYIFAGRSSNNNINRVLRFSGGGYYQGANISSLNRFEVSANYTVYDFEDVSSGLRSFSFRQLTATDSSRIKFSGRFSFVVTGYVKISEQADFNWGDFVERPTRHLREIFADPKILLTFKDAYFGAGARYFSLNTFDYEGLTRIPKSQYLSIGPLVEIFYNITGSLYLKINGWYEFITIDSKSTREQSNLVMALNWKF